MGLIYPRLEQVLPVRSGGFAALVYYHGVTGARRRQAGHGTTPDEAIAAALALGPIEEDPWQALRTDLWEENHGHCFYCGGYVDPVKPRERTIDHIVPRCVGGPDERWNLVPCCRSCNSAKGDAPATYWGRRSLQRRLIRLGFDHGMATRHRDAVMAHAAVVEQRYQRQSIDRP